jgi:purine nucleosidase
MNFSGTKVLAAGVLPNDIPHRVRGNYNYPWDELTALAWLDPTLITKKETLYMDIDLDDGANYGNTLTWTEPNKPKLEVNQVEVQDDPDLDRFC